MEMDHRRGLHPARQQMEEAVRRRINAPGRSQRNLEKFEDLRVQHLQRCDCPHCCQPSIRKGEYVNGATCPVAWQPSVFRIIIPGYEVVQLALTTLYHHTTSQHSSHNAIPASVPAGSPLVHGDPGQRSGQTNTASTTNGQLPSPSHELAPSVRRATVARIPQHARPCYLLVTLGLLVIGGSLAIGLYYSIAKHRMGDGFTTAGWMTAAGTLVLAAPVAKHYPHCRCWGTGYTMLRQGHNTQV